MFKTPFKILQLAFGEGFGGAESTDSAQGYIGHPFLLNPSGLRLFLRRFDFTGGIRFAGVLETNKCPTKYCIKKIVFVK